MNGDHLVCHRAERIVVRYENDCHAQVSVEAFDYLEHLFAVFVIERTCRLVAEQDPRLFGYCSRDRHSLLLAARKSRRESLESIVHLHFFEDFRRIEGIFLHFDAEIHVFDYIEVRDQVVELEREADLSCAVFRQLRLFVSRYVVSVYNDFS